MPELPEVETTLRGVAPHVCGKEIAAVVVRNRQLRWPVPENLSSLMAGQKVEAVVRRAKYLLFRCDNGHLLIHLGMSGSLRLVAAESEPNKHDHVDIVLVEGIALRFTDPRRFGAVLWLEGDPLLNPLLRHLGPEPFSEEFHGEYLWRRSRQRKVPVKTFLMDNRIVVGVGNIYANEALFMAGVRPDRSVGRISRQRFERLADNIVAVLSNAIEQGGTTLKDFTGSDGKPGYFSQQLRVYGRGGKGCVTCGRVLKEVRLGQRSTVFCTRCQR